MNINKLISRNLYFYRKKHLSVFLGVILSSTILIGALIIGDSVKYSLQRLVDKRLGKVQFALSSGERIFRAELSEQLADIYKTSCSAALYTNGVIVTEGGQGRLNKINFYGVDRNFDNIADHGNVYRNIPEDEVIVNSHIADQLNVSVGDEVLLRLKKIDSMPKDSPLSDDTDITIAERFKVKYVSDDDEFGRFGLKSEQIAPFNIFLNIDKLNSLMDMEQSANMLMIESKEEYPIELYKLNETLDSIWNLQDSGIKLQSVENGSKIELRSNRVFIDNPLIRAANKTQINFSEILTYFVNEIGDRRSSIPYSFVSAADNELIGQSLDSNEIVINSWAAKDLSLKTGSNLKLKYFIVGENRKLSIDSSNFMIKAIVKMDGIFKDQNLLPDYPGLAESESCMDWHPGIPIDFDKIRDKDELYWEKFKGTPKAFISLAKGKELWKNRFGSITAIRFLTDDMSRVESRLNDSINPSDWNIEFSNVRKSGLDASQHSVDFGGLFIGLSFFIIISALLLTSLLFLFNFESRVHEIGLFVGLGYNHSQIKKILLKESAAVIIIGSLIGCILGIFYNKLILMALGSVWSNAVGTSALEISINPSTILFGFLIVAVLHFFIIWLSVRNKLQITAHNLQRGISISRSVAQKKYLYISVISLLVTVLLLIATNPGKGSESFGLYFLVGILMLVSGISFISYILDYLNSKKKFLFNKYELVLKELLRKKSRTIILITLLASSLFIVFTVGLNKKNVNSDSFNIKSGTGGYGLFGETSIPIYNDLNDLGFRKTLGIDKFDINDIKFVQMKVKTGDDASCLNLNRVVNPQIFGVNSSEFSDRDAFTFTSLSPHVNNLDPWSVLNKKIGNKIIPGIADASVIQWQLGKSVGDTLKYKDDSGNEFSILLVAGLENSIFQGNILISESNFIEKFPSVSGSKCFIADSRKDKQEELIRQLNYFMQDYGLNLSTTHERLSEFNKVENTYLSIFLILGSFGILIGSLGIGIIVFRNVSEQKRELSLLQAIGFAKNQLISMINIGYLFILIYGIVLGILAAFAASLPSLISENSEIPVWFIVGIIMLITFTGFCSIYLTTKSSLRGNINELLRNE